MKLNEIMTRNVQVVDPSTTLEEAASLMKSLDVGGLPICDGEKLLGFVTDRDITLRAVAEGEDPSVCKVSDIMSSGVQYCFEGDEVEEAARLMKENQIRRLLVLDDDKKLVGIVSLGDIATESHGEGSPGEVLERISEPAQPSA